MGHFLIQSKLVCQTRNRNNHQATQRLRPNHHTCSKYIGRGMGQYRRPTLGQNTVTTMPNYKQGDVVVVNFPFTDISQTKKRPALVVSNYTVSWTGDYLLVQITSQVKNDDLSLPVSTTDFINNALPLASFVRLHKLFLLNESLIIKNATAVTPTFYQELVRKIITLIEWFFEYLSYKNIDPQTAGRWINKLA